MKTRIRTNRFISVYMAIVLALGLFMAFPSYAYAAAPPAPSNVTATAGLDGITVEWTNTATNPTTFHFERREGLDAPWIIWMSITGSATTLLDDKVEAGKTYAYRLRVLASNEYSAFSNEVSATAPLNYPIQVRGQPLSQIVPAGWEVHYYVAAVCSGYSWERRTATNTLYDPWTTLIDDDVYSGTSTNRLLITNVPASYDGYEYRCFLKHAVDPSLSRYTDVAKLTVNPATISLSTLTWHPGAAASSTNVSVHSNTTWTISSSAAWLTTVPSGVTSFIDRIITINAATNTGSQRRGTLTFTGGGVTQTFTVTQAAASTSTSGQSTVTPGGANPSGDGPGLIHGNKGGVSPTRILVIVFGVVLVAHIAVGYGMSVKKNRRPAASAPLSASTPLSARAPLSASTPPATQESEAIQSTSSEPAKD